LLWDAEEYSKGIEGEGKQPPDQGFQKISVPLKHPNFSLVFLSGV